MRKNDKKLETKKQDTYNLADFEMSFEIARVSLDDGAYCGTDDMFIRGAEGKVYYKDGKSPVGRLIAYVVDVALANEREVDIFGILDSHSQQMSDHVALFDLKNQELDRELSLTEFFGSGMNLLILDKVEVVPEFRGWGLGLHIARTAIEVLGKGCGAVALEPHPIQYSEETPSEWSQRVQGKKFGGTKAQGIKQLSRYWKRLGFRRVRKTRFFVLDRSLKAVVGRIDRVVSSQAEEK